ncbi:MAG: hypothetical protein WAW31_10090 [Smithella sp.]
MCQNLTRLKKLGVFLTAALILSCVAFYNGYPLVYPDTGGYIGLQDNLIRSFFYNLFIFPSLWFKSLWPVVFLQSLIIAHLLQLVLRVVFKTTSLFFYLLMITLLCALTNLPWFTGFIMPDIFTGTMILSLYLLIFCTDHLSLGEKIYLFLLTVLSATVHLTHIPLAVGVIAISWCFRMFIKNKEFLPMPRILISCCAISLAFILIIANNYRLYGAFTMSRGGYAFLLSMLICDGPAVNYLKESCPSKRYKLCDYIDELPSQPDQFLWSVESPFRKVGWISGYRIEGTEIIKETIIRFPFLIIKNSLLNTIRQLPMINNWYGICSYIKFPYPTEIIREYYPSDFHAYATSRQSLNSLSLNFFNHLHRTVIFFSLLLAPLMFIIFLKYRQYLPSLLLISIACAYVISSFITGTLNPHNRYGSRIIWLLPFFSMASLMHVIDNWKEYLRTRIDNSVHASGIRK